MSAEERPSRREGFLEALLGAVAETPVYVYDREHRVVEYFWGRAKTPWGIEPSDLLGRRLADVVGPEDAAPVERMLREVFETGQPRNVEASIGLPIGRRWFDVRLAPIPGPDGAVEYVIVASHELTERRRAAEALLQSQQRFQTLAESVPIGILRTDAEGRCLYRNPLARELSGVSDADLAAHGWRSNVHPDDRERAAAVRREIFQAPRIFDQELRVLRPDGTSTWIFSRSAPTWDEQGRFDGFITSFFDITGRKAANDALHESEHRFHSLAEAMPIGVWRTNQELKLVYANRRNWELLDLDPDDPENLDLGRLLDRMVAMQRIDDAESERLWDESVRVVRDQIVNPSRFELQLADGSQRSLQTLALPEFDSAGAFVGTVGVTIDVTDLTRAQQELARHRDHLGELVAERSVELERSYEALRRSERLAAVGTFAAGIAHQINNPVGSILLAAQFAQEEPGNRERVVSALRDIAADARRCGRIVRGVLEFAQGPIADPRPCDLNQIAQDCVRKLAPEAAERGAALRVDLAADLPLAAGSESALDQVIANLVTNSIEAAAREIVVRTRARERGIDLVVRDDGSGIGEEDIDRIFDPLFTTRGERGGTGLGLALARGVIEAHGGSIGVRSLEGKGTTVTVRLRRA